MEKIYNVKKADGTVCEMTYSDVCKALGFVPEIEFVKVTNAGTISYYAGKPSEIKALYRAVKNNGLVPAKALANICKYL